MDNSSEMNQTDLPTIELPSPEILDYAEIAMLTVLLVIGVPLNFVSFIRILRKPSADTDTNRVVSRTIRQQIKAAHKTIMRASALEFHLTIANLLVICLYGFSQICWLLTYSWQGGDMLCRLVKFCDTFCFYATSNIVVCISIDRVYVSSHVDRPMRPRRQRSQIRPFKNNTTLNMTLAIAWILAFVCSIPQLLVWREFTPYLPQYPDWHQCVTVFILATVDPGNPDFARYDKQVERIYTTLHLFFVFWIPLVIILLSYALIIVRFREKITVNVRDTRLQQRAINAILFKKRASSFHRKCRQERFYSAPAPYTGTETASEVPAPGQVSENGDGNSSAGRLASVPIVINCSQAFICQPMIATTAVKTLTRAQRRAIKMAFWIVLAYILCFSPYNALVLYRFIDQSFESRFLEFSANFIVLNAVLNPIIYKMR